MPKRKYPTLLFEKNAISKFQLCLFISLCFVHSFFCATYIFRWLFWIWGQKFWFYICQLWSISFSLLRSFFQLVGDLGELQDKVYTDLIDKPKGKDSREFIAQPSVECLDIELDDLEVVATLGIGGFGRVELVKVSFSFESFVFQYKVQYYIILNLQCRGRPSNTFALKCLKKQHIVETQQQEHVFSERNIMMSCRNMFITRYKWESNHWGDMFSK